MFHIETLIKCLVMGGLSLMYILCIVAAICFIPVNIYNYLSVSVNLFPNSLVFVFMVLAVVQPATAWGA